MDPSNIRGGLVLALALLATFGSGRALAQAVPPAAGRQDNPGGSPPGPSPTGAPGAAPTAPPADSAPAPGPPPPPLPPPPDANGPEAPVVLSGPPGAYSGPPSSAPGPSGAVVTATTPPAPPPPLPPCENSGKPSPCVQPDDAYRHDGFYLRLGGGIGYGALFGSGPSGDASISGLSAGTLLAIGGNIGEGLVLAGAFQGAQIRNTFEGSPAPQKNASASTGQLGVLLDWFPDPTGGWHVGAVAGIGFAMIADAEIKDASGLGVGGAVFGGHDFWIGPQWSAGLFVAVGGSTSTELMDRKGDKSGYTLAGWSGTLGYSFMLH